MGGVQGGEWVIHKGPHDLLLPEGPIRCPSAPAILDK